MSKMVTIEHRRVGPIEVPEESVLYFEEIPGFPGAERFIVMDHVKDSPFYWLASLDDPNLAFVIANPWNFFPDYDLAVSDAEIERLKIEKSEEVEVVTIVSLEAEQVWFNLVAPILINRTTRRGMQVILDDSRYSVRVAMPKPQEIAEVAVQQRQQEVRDTGE